MWINLIISPGIQTSQTYNIGNTIAAHQTSTLQTPGGEEGREVCRGPGLGNSAYDLMTLPSGQVPVGYVPRCYFIDNYYSLCTKSTLWFGFETKSYCIYTERDRDRTGQRFDNSKVHVWYWQNEHNSWFLCKATPCALQDRRKEGAYSRWSFVTLVHWCVPPNWHIPNSRCHFQNVLKSFSRSEENPRRKSFKKFCIPLILMMQKLSLCGKT